MIHAVLRSLPVFLFLIIGSGFAVSQVTAHNNTETSASIRVTVDCGGVETHLLPVIVPPNSTLTINIPPGCGAVEFVEWAVVADNTTYPCGWSGNIDPLNYAESRCLGTNFVGSASASSSSNWGTYFND